MLSQETVDTSMLHSAGRVIVLCSWTCYRDYTTSKSDLRSASFGIKFQVPAALRLGANLIDMPFFASVLFKE